MHCPQSFPQIDRDLALYASVDPDRNAREIPLRFGQRQSLCHYTVKDNKVPRTLRAGGMPWKNTGLGSTRPVQNTC